jgi:predicted esterase
MSHDPHGAQPVLHAGAALDEARLVLIMVHGRGAGADDMIGLAGEFVAPGLAFLAPQASGHTWYPYPFTSPLEANEPGLSSGLGKIGSLIETAAEAGVGADRLVLLGFSQGACLALEYAARNARRYRAVVALSGGLIGPPGTPRDYAGTFDATPAFFGCSDVDPHIPLERVNESAEVFRRMGAAVDERIYPRMGHTVNADEIAAVRALLT